MFIHVCHVNMVLYIVTYCHVVHQYLSFYRESCWDKYGNKHKEMSQYVLTTMSLFITLFIAGIKW